MESIERVTIATPDAIQIVAVSFSGSVAEGRDNALIVEFPNIDHAWGFAKVVKEWEWDFKLHQPVASFTEPVLVWVGLA
ncbi:hypothetical protein ACFP2T_43385 [Plantactinospora solaniradicis]|uniref:Uncharacterized protein n=1 Tax=Plantactinospora solaniradicis TaxID=1723736 RepID=A0ABW1KMF4_9ACTN